MKFALHTCTALSPILTEPKHFYVDIYYLIILIIVTFALLLLSFCVITFIRQKGERTERNSESCG